jgi:8-oxo-dGTP pyrophosphatase MutT (NUDIX family)
MSGVIRVVALAVIIRPHTCEFLVFRGSDPTRNLEYHRPLGGGVEFGESAFQTIRREVLEEIGIEVVPVRLLTATESLFVAGGQPKHEIGLLVECRFSNPALYETEVFPDLEGNGEDGVWRKAETPVTLFPEGMPQALRASGLIP